jgi:hypothetical protein
MKKTNAERVCLLSIANKNMRSNDTDEYPRKAMQNITKAAQSEKTR